jgi:L-lactate utilization protein LutB
MDEIANRDNEDLRAKEADLKAYNEVDVYELGREASRRLDRFRRDIEQIHEAADTIKHVRESAIDQLREAIRRWHNQVSQIGDQGRKTRLDFLALTNRQVVCGPLTFSEMLLLS